MASPFEFLQDVIITASADKKSGLFLEKINGADATLDAGVLGYKKDATGEVVVFDIETFVNNKVQAASTAANGIDRLKSFKDVKIQEQKIVFTFTDKNDEDVVKELPIATLMVDVNAEALSFDAGTLALKLRETDGSEMTADFSVLKVAKTEADGKVTIKQGETTVTEVYTPAKVDELIASSIQNAQPKAYEDTRAYDPNVPVTHTINLGVGTKYIVQAFNQNGYHALPSIQKISETQFIVTSTKAATLTVVAK